MRARLLACGVGLSALGCAGAGQHPGNPSQPGQVATASRVQLFPVSIVFEPALASTGTLSVRHESGWTTEVPAPPSGVDLAMPEGPASLLLSVGERQFERTLKVAPGSRADASSCVWQLPQ